MTTRIGLISTAILLLTLGFLLAALLVIPRITGYTVSCTYKDQPINQSICEEAWQNVGLEGMNGGPLGLEALIPITAVRIKANYPNDPACGEWWVQRPGPFDMLVYRDC